MRVLIACEFSGIVRDAFADRGHDAMSCDLLPSERPGKHYQGDIVDVLETSYGQIDLMIAHPPCTYLCSSGLHWNHRTPGRDKLTQEAFDFVMCLLNADIPKIALENPVGRIGTAYHKADQVIQPWMFGEDASKATCLWLKGLPLLEPTKIIPPRGWQLVKFAMDLPLCPCCEEERYCDEHEMHYADCDCIGPTQDGIAYKVINGFLFGIPEDEYAKPVWSNQTPSGQNKLGPSPTRAAERARTYQGIAEAMAKQWG